MYCLDWDAIEFEIYGSDDFNSFQSLDVEAQTCSTYVSLFGKDSEDEPDCIDDYDLAIKYFKNSAFIIYSNEGQFAPQDFDNPVKKISTLKKRQFDEKQAHWYDTFVNVHRIEE